MVLAGHPWQLTSTGIPAPSMQRPFRSYVSAVETVSVHAREEPDAPRSSAAAAGRPADDRHVLEPLQPQQEVLARGEGELVDRARPAGPASARRRRAARRSGERRRQLAAADAVADRAEAWSPWRKRSACGREDEVAARVATEIEDQFSRAAEIGERRIDRVVDPARATWRRGDIPAPEPRPRQAPQARRAGRRLLPASISTARRSRAVSDRRSPSAPPGAAAPRDRGASGAAPRSVSASPAVGDAVVDRRARRQPGLTPAA